MMFLKGPRHLSQRLNKIQCLLLHNKAQDTYFITTPIFYVNAAPHIGHLYSALLADAQNRFQRLHHKVNCILTTGTDEHGLKIQQAAAAERLDVTQFCNKVSSQFKEAFLLANIEFSDFVRTTEERHKAAVHHFWNVLKTNGFIYKGQYAGWYCTADEVFLSEKDILEVKDANGNLQKISAESGHPVEWTEESNYMFSLSKFQDDILNWLAKENVVKPKKFHLILQQMVKEGLKDLSVSRSISRLQWGIPVPDDSSQIIYVWLDALINYLTVRGYPNPEFCWPADCHVIGKEILKFHGIYWPAFLMAAGLELPKSILCHSHWTVDNQKMSKSKGNSINALTGMMRYSPDGLRYFLLREGVPHGDGNFSEKKLVRIVNAELGDTLGNLLNRIMAPTLNRHQVYPPIHQEIIQRLNSNTMPFIKNVQDLPDSVYNHYKEFNFYHGLEDIMDVLRQTNLFVQTEKPWELKNQPHEHKLLDTILGIATEALRTCGLLLLPVVPRMAGDLLDRLNVPETGRCWAEAERSFVVLKGGISEYEGKKLNTKTHVLFKKIRLDDEEIPTKTKSRTVS